MKAYSSSSNSSVNAAAFVNASAILFLTRRILCEYEGNEALIGSGELFNNVLDWMDATLRECEDAAGINGFRSAYRAAMQQVRAVRNMPSSSGNTVEDISRILFFAHFALRALDGAGIPNAAITAGRIGDLNFEITSLDQSAGFRAVEYASKKIEGWAAASMAA